MLGSARLSIAVYDETCYPVGACSALTRRQSDEQPPHRSPRHTKGPL